MNVFKISTPIESPVPIPGNKLATPETRSKEPDSILSFLKLSHASAKLNKLPRRGNLLKNGFPNFVTNFVALSAILAKSNPVC